MNVIPLPDPRKALALPTVSRWLADAIQQARNPHPDIGFERGRLRPGTIEEARRLLPALDQALRIATGAEWHEWLVPMAVLPNAPTRGEAFRGAVGVIAFALRDTPAIILTPDRQREALRSFRFWPTPKEIADLLAPTLREIAAKRAAVRRIAETENAPRHDPASEDEREEIRAGLAALSAELSSRCAEAAERERRETPLAPRLSDGALLAKYERLAAEGGPGAIAAAMRAEALRARIAAASDGRLAP